MSHERLLSSELFLRPDSLLTSFIFMLCGGERECVSAQDSDASVCERRLWDASDFNDVYEAAVAYFLFFLWRPSLVLWSSLAIVCRSVKTTIKSESLRVGVSERTWGGNTLSLQLHSITFRSSANSQRSSRWPLTSSHATPEAHGLLTFTEYFHFTQNFFFFFSSSRMSTLTRRMSLLSEHFSHFICILLSPSHCDLKLCNII